MKSFFSNEENVVQDKQPAVLERANKFLFLREYCCQLFNVPCQEIVKIMNEIFLSKYDATSEHAIDPFRKSESPCGSPNSSNIAADRRSCSAK